MGDNSAPTHTAHSNSSKMTDEERLKLAEKLDKELDAWMDGLEKRAYSDGWPEDRWEEEMEKHPFFMTKFPENGTDNPLLQGIQQLKYDETVNTPLELAQSYKEDGNFNFKHKKYRMAVLSYTEGLRRKCNDNEMNATLYNNRSAAQFYLKNYRSSFLDCKQCLKLKADHDKALHRAAQCCIQLKLPKEAIEYCTLYLSRHPDNSEMKKLKVEATNLQKMIDRNHRKVEQAERKEANSLSALKRAISSRGVQVDVQGDPDEVLLGMHEKPKLQEDGSLTWPVFFLYPEFSISDFIQEFNENDTMLSMLETLFEERPEWDAEGVYEADNVSVYFEGVDRTQLHSVDITSKLGTILKTRGFIARDWRPAFLVFVKGSVAETHFINNYSVV